MSAHPIRIDPMIPHYRVSNLHSNSKGGKASRDSSDSKSNSSSIVPKNGQVEKFESDTIELKAVKDADKRAESRYASDEQLKQAEKDGIKEAMKETVKEHRKNTFKFFGLMNKSEKLVFRMRNIIPILTGEVVVDTTKITFIHRPFFFSERIHAVSIKDVTDVYVETVPFFGTLNVVDQNFAENTVKINWVWKREAEKARRIITGLMAAAKEGVDLKNIEDDALDEKLEEIGRLRETSTSVSKA